MFVYILKFEIMDAMVFNIITYIILGIAFFITGKKIVEKLFSKDKSSCSSGCSGCNSKCELKSLVDSQKVNL